MTITIGVLQQVSDQTNVVVASVLVNSDQILPNPLSTLVQPVYFNQIYATLQIDPNQYQIGQVTLAQVPVPFQGIYTYQFAVRFVLIGTPVTSQQFVGPVGPPGIAGKAGMAGAVGPEGPAGPTGPQGPQGFTGATGPFGGPPGPTGDRGPTGPFGATGVRGAPGIPGFTGAPGPTGQIGPRGATGIQGVTGPMGNIGLQGPTGPRGATGPQGILGPLGPTGSIGPTGSLGPTGPIGPELSTITAPDGFTNYWWKLDEPDNSSTLFNSGMIGPAGNLSVHGTVIFGGTQPTVGNSSTRTGRAGIFNGAVDFFQDTVAVGSTARGQTTGSPTLLPTTMSVHGWLRLHSLSNTGVASRIFSIWWDSAGNTPSSAPDAIALVIANNTANMFAQANVGGGGGSNKTTITLVDDPIPLLQWCHVGITYSGDGIFAPGHGTINIYLNGNRVLTDSSWYGSIDLTGGPAGDFSIGGTPFPFSGITGEFDDWRAETTLRSDAYMLALYKAGKPC